MSKWPKWSQEERSFVLELASRKVHPKDIKKKYDEVREKKGFPVRTLDAIARILSKEGIGYAEWLTEEQKARESVPLEKRVESDRKIQKLNDEVRELKSKYTELIRERGLEELLIETLKDEVKALPEVELKWTPNIKKVKTEETAVLLLSDLHTGEIVDKEAMMGLGEYDFETMSKRLKYLAESVGNLTLNYLNNQKLPKLIIQCLGDMVSGTIHQELVENSEDVIFQVLNGSFVVSQMILELAQYYPEIEVDGIVGNHGRLSKKKKFKKSYINWDYVFYQFMGTFLSVNPRIKCNFPKSFFLSRQIYDWWFLGLHGDNIRCFTPDAPVILHDGTPKSIQYVAPGDQVIGADGRIRSVSHRHSYNYEGDMVYIDAYGLPSPTWQAIPKHQVLVVPQQSGTAGEPEWVPIGHVSEGDYLVIPHHHTLATKTTLKPQQYIGKKQHWRTNEIPQNIPIDFRLGYVLGQYLADGSISGSSIEVSYNAEEQEFWEDYQKYMFELFDYKPRLIKREDLQKRCQRVQIYRKRIADLFVSLAGKGSRTKKLHPDVLNWTKQSLQGLLVGYLRGDGHTSRRKYHYKYTTNRVMASTTSINLGYQLFWIARKCGYNPALKLRTRSGVQEAILGFYGEDARELGEQTQRNFNTNYSPPTSQHQKIINRIDYTLVRVRKAYRKQYKGKVYDLTIAGQATYTVNNAVVHNSWAGIPWYGIQRKTAKLREIVQRKKQILNYVNLGHFHNTGELDQINGEILLNGSVIGGNEYAFARLFTYDRPTQLFYGVHPEKGVTWRYPIRLDFPEVDKVKPYNYNRNLQASEYMKHLMDKKE